MTNNLYNSILDGIEIFRSKHPTLTELPVTSHLTVHTLISALQEFMECVRYLNRRRSTGAILNLNSEAEVQDTVYLMLRPWIHDLVPENPTDRIANRYSVKDFLSCSLRTVIEVKFIRNADHGKSVVKELNDDIETYRYHQYCDHLIFFIYDPDAHIPDVSSLVRHVSDKRTYSEKTLHCYVIVRP